MIAKVITLDLFWMLLLLIIGFIIRLWIELNGVRKVTIFSITVIVAAIICSYPWLI